MPNDNDVQIIAPKNTLKDRLGSSVGTIDPEAIQRAEVAMTKLKVEFSDWLAKDIAHLSQTHAAFLADRTADNAGALFLAAHDLKGQATTFGYPLIARIAGSLSKLLDELKKCETAPPALVTAHVDAINVIHRDKIKDVSNRTALILTEELEAKVRVALAKDSLAA